MRCNQPFILMVITPPHSCLIRSTMRWNCRSKSYSSYLTPGWIDACSSRSTCICDNLTPVSRREGCAFKALCNCLSIRIGWLPGNGYISEISSFFSNYSIRRKRQFVNRNITHIHICCSNYNLTRCRLITSSSSNIVIGLISKNIRNSEVTGSIGCCLIRFITT